MTLYFISVFCFILYVIYREAVYYRFVKSETSFLTCFDSFLSQVRHHYYYCNSISDSVFLSLEECSGDFKKRMERVEDVLSCEDPDLQQAMLSVELHKYERLFVSVAVLVQENGDIYDKEGSAFLNSLMQLRSDVQEEKRYLESRRHRFMGLSLTAALPAVSVPFISSWGSGTIPTLTYFYYGVAGSLFRGFLLILSIAVYCAICYMREQGCMRFGSRSVVEKEFAQRAAKQINTLKRLPKFVISVMTMLIVVLSLIPILINAHRSMREILRSDISNVESLSDYADGKQIKAMERVIPQYVCTVTERDKHAADRTDISELEIVLTDELLSEEGIRTREVAEAASKEIIRRVARHRREYFGIADIAILLVAGILGYVTPFIIRGFKNVFAQNRRLEEILLFQSLIHMQKRVPGMSSVLLLESMESFASIYKPSIRRCLNEYSINDKEALRQLASAEKHPGFKRIVDCFLAVDEAGIEEAFNEVSDEIINFKENRKQERVILLDNDALLASLLAIIPGSTILFGYLLIPFMSEALKMFNSYQNSLSDYISVSR